VGYTYCESWWMLPSWTLFRFESPLSFTSCQILMVRAFLCLFRQVIFGSLASRGLLQAHLFTTPTDNFRIQFFKLCARLGILLTCRIIYKQSSNMRSIQDAQLSTRSILPQTSLPNDLSHGSSCNAYPHAFRAS
jgi:hypothetical protein